MTFWRRAATAAVTSAVLASALTMATPTVASAAESNGGTRIMPLGDSITEGGGAYRTRLWERFQADGHTVDFVGSGSNGPTTLGDRDHEGHSGWKIAGLDSSIAGWLATSRPRTVLLHIGTNDVWQNDNLAQAPARLSALIDKIRAGAPAADIFVATIIPFADATSEARVQAFNATIPGIVDSKDDRVHLVDMHSALTAADLSDGVHPNAAGNIKMADTWYAALQQVPRTLRAAPAVGTAVNVTIGTTNRCLDVYAASTQPLAQTIVWDCHGGSNQRWTRTAANELRVYGSSCLDVLGAATAAGSKVIIYPCHGGANQKWTFLGDGSIQNPVSGRCLAGSAGSTNQATEMVLADCAVSASQLWTAG